MPPRLLEKTRKNSGNEEYRCLSGEWENGITKATQRAALNLGAELRVRNSTGIQWSQDRATSLVPGKHTRP